jgi:hypothetical protein
MAGYANRVITKHFPDLSDEDSDVFVVFKNPKTQAMSALEAAAVKTNADGSPEDGEATVVVYGLLSRLIIGGNLYDARVDGIDADNQPLDQPLLTYPLTPESAAGLPLEVITAIVTDIKEAQNPQ